MKAILEENMRLRKLFESAKFKYFMQLVKNLGREKIALQKAQRVCIEH